MNEKNTSRNKAEKVTALLLVSHRFLCFLSLILIVGGVMDTKQTLFRNLWPDEAHAYQSSAVQPFKGHRPRYRHHLRH